MHKRARRLFLVLMVSLLLVFTSKVMAQQLPIYLWFEPEWFEGVKGYTEYHSGPERLNKVQDHWGIAGPGISAEWTQGGESEWNSMAAGPNDDNVSCQREIVIPRTGKYKVWVRYYDHRNKEEPFTVRIEQNGKNVLEGELGVDPVVPPNDEFSLYWGFSFGWGAVEGELKEGPATLRLLTTRKSEVWRQLDAVMITDDLQYQPVAREKPRFAYFDAFKLQPQNNSSWRGAIGSGVLGLGHRPSVAGRDFSMWVTTTSWSTYPWWKDQNPDTLSLYDVIFHTAAPEDIRAEFHKQFAGRQDVPLVAWKNYVPGFSLHTPDLSPDTPLRKWLEKTKTPFYILVNNAEAQYNATNGPASYAALTGPLKDQFLGYLSGEAFGTEDIKPPKAPLGKTRREHIDNWGKDLIKQNAASYSKQFKITVPESIRAKSIPCLSTDSTAMAHLLYETGSTIVGYEIDGTTVHTPMRIAFERGAAHQYGGAWINYASGNFGDACNYFAQEPIVARGAKGWFHSKYAVTDGVPISWYRKMYYLNYLSGGSAIFWEQSLHNQWIKPGPGEHPVQLSPFGRATEDFQAFVDRLPDRGEPYVPIGVLLSYGNGYEPAQYIAKMMDHFTQDANDRELRELFNVFWYPSPVFEGRPSTPSVQNLVSGIYGNIFDVLVDRPERLKAINDYPILWAAGDVELGGKSLPALREYLQRGGTLVVNINAAKNKLPPDLLGVQIKNERKRFESWKTGEGATQPSTPYEVELIELKGAKPLAFAADDVPLITRHAVGKGAVIGVLVPRGVGLDERAHPALPYLMNGLTKDLLPIEVLTSDGAKPSGEIMYQLNKTKDGWLVMLMNNRGVDKTQHGIARVDRTQFVDVVLRTALLVKSSQEYTQPRALPVEKNGAQNEIKVRVPAGDVQVVSLTVAQ